MLLVISSSPLLYSLDLPRSRMYLVPCTFHHRLAGINGSLFRWGLIVSPGVLLKKTHYTCIFFRQHVIEFLIVHIIRTILTQGAILIRLRGRTFLNSNCKLLPACGVRKLVLANLSLKGVLL